MDRIGITSCQCRSRRSVVWCFRDEGVRLWQRLALILSRKALPVPWQWGSRMRLPTMKLKIFRYRGLFLGTVLAQTPKRPRRRKVSWQNSFTTWDWWTGARLEAIPFTVQGPFPERKVSDAMWFLTVFNLKNAGNLRRCKKHRSLWCLLTKRMLPSWMQPVIFRAAARLELSRIRNSVPWSRSFVDFWVESG